MMMRKVSLVMPVYNTNPDLFKDAVESVLKQEYDCFELIIVDDGSSEEIAGLCDAFLPADSRIRVVHQENSGVSAARNNGTALSTGDYVMYMDSDDVLAPYALREGMEIIDRTGAQFLFAGVQHIKNRREFNCTASAEPEFTVYSKDETDVVRKAFLTQRKKEYLNINATGFVNRGPCARLIRTDIAKSVKFDDRLRIGEDVEWNMRILNACDCVCFVSSLWYGYIVYESSSLHKYYGNRAQLLERYHKILYENNRDYCSKNPEDYATNMAVSFYSMVLYEYMSDKCPLKESEKRRELKSILKREPWTIMSEPLIRKKLPLRYRAFINACKCGAGLAMLKIWERIKRWKR